MKLLPEAKVASESTEIAWVDGVAFVNAAKHEQVVAMRCEERDDARAKLAEMERQRGPNDPPVRAYFHE